jgi:hypothetical protein
MPAKSKGFLVIAEEKCHNLQLSLCAIQSDSGIESHAQ